MSVQSLLRNGGSPVWLKRAGFLFSVTGGIGALIFILMVSLSVFGYWLTPYGFTSTVGMPSQPPSDKFWLGTDAMGRDVLSRVLVGGTSVLTTATITTVLIYLIGVTIGITAAKNRGIIDSIVMRTIDVIMVFPAIMLLLLLASGLGSGIHVIILGIVIVHIPGVARLVRTAAMEISISGYVESAVARGESSFHVTFREILPNITHVILADMGVRFSSIVALAASMSFLGLGIMPPNADWGLMISENRMAIYTNPMAVIVPSVMLSLLVISINLMSDAFIKTHVRGGTR